MPVKVVVNDAGAGPSNAPWPPDPAGDVSPRILRTPTHLSIQHSSSAVMSRVFSQLDLSPSASFSARPSQGDLSQGGEPLSMYDWPLARQLGSMVRITRACLPRCPLLPLQQKTLNTPRPQGSTQGLRDAIFLCEERHCTDSEARPLPFVSSGAASKKPPLVRINSG